MANRPRKNVRRRVISQSSAFNRTIAALGFGFGAIIGGAITNLLYEPSARSTSILVLAVVAVGFVAWRALQLMGRGARSVWGWATGMQVRVSEYDVRPRPILLVFVSDQSYGSDKVAMDHHLGQRNGKKIQDAGYDPALKECWLLHTDAQGSQETANMRGREYESDDREPPFRVECFTKKISNGNSVQATATAIEEVLESILNRRGRHAVTPKDVIVDVTGGTKMMTTGAVLACLQYGIDMEYVRYPVNPDTKRPELNKPDQVTVQIVDIGQFPASTPSANPVMAG